MPQQVAPNRNFDVSQVQDWCAQKLLIDEQLTVTFLANFHLNVESNLFAGYLNQQKGEYFSQVLFSDSTL